MLEILLDQSIHNTYSAAFFKFSSGEPKESLVNRLQELKAIGLNRVIAGYGTRGMEAAKFDDTYYAALEELVEACRETDMTFWLEDYSPFPTGSADGAFKDPENAGLNKLFLDERHIDICGPVEQAVIRIDDLQRVVYGKALHRFAKLDPSARKRVAVIACRLQENPVCAAAPILEDDTAILLNDHVEGRFLKWRVPEGDWRIFVIFETYESAGRPFFMNLLSKESVALEIEKVHEPIYAHLKNLLGKTWNGFFYDEPEIGNAGGANVFDYFMLPGRRSKDKTDCNVYPWSPEMPLEMTKRDDSWLKKLPFLWYDAQKQHEQFRCDYMDAVTSLVRENYNGQVHAFCRERGIHYIGHVLEDENSHARLGCGPGHYFRQQYYQDEAGIDVIAGQILPGRDKAISWYGITNSDGEFYHYGIAKLASSEAHINPLKNNRSVCETFAMYGQQGLAERKYVVDHLLVSGVNRILFGELSAYEASSDYAKALVNYTDRICGLLRTTTPVIMTAVLYHAEAEWQEGETAQLFQKPAAELARNQISYDVIPADVFSFPSMYNTETGGGLCVNGNVYKALIIPACNRLPESVASFIRQGTANGYPVFFVDRVPEGFSDCRWTSLKNLANVVRQTIDADIKVKSSRQEWIRYAHVRSDNEDFYLIHNQAPHGSANVQIILNTGNEVLAIDPISGIVLAPAQETLLDGRVKIIMNLGQHEMKILYSGNGSHAKTNRVRVAAKTRHDAAWELELPDGRIISGGAGQLPDLADFLDCDFYGKLIYRTKCNFEDQLPKLLDLGKVSDCCEAILNGHNLGKRLANPYLYDVEAAVRSGINELTIEVYTSAVNVKNEKSIFGIPLNALNAMPYALVEPMGISGQVTWLFEK